MGFDALFEPMINRTQSEIVLEGPEGGLDLGQLNIEGSSLFQVGSLSSSLPAIR